MSKTKKRKKQSKKDKQPKSLVAVQAEPAEELAAPLKLDLDQFETCMMCLGSVYDRLHHPWPTRHFQRIATAYRMQLYETRQLLRDKRLKDDTVMLTRKQMKIVREAIADNLAFFLNLRGSVGVGINVIVPAFSNAFLTKALRDSTQELSDLAEHVRLTIVEEFYDDATDKVTSQWAPSVFEQSVESE